MLVKKSISLPVVMVIIINQKALAKYSKEGYVVSGLSG
jgi:hypothetical protein